MKNNIFKFISLYIIYIFVYSYAFNVIISYNELYFILILFSYFDVMTNNQNKKINNSLKTLYLYIFTTLKKINFLNFKNFFLYIYLNFKNFITITIHIFTLIFNFKNWYSMYRKNGYFILNNTMKFKYSKLNSVIKYKNYN